MRTASSDTVVVSSSWMAKLAFLSFSCSWFWQSAAILSILSFTVLSESGTVFTLSAACGPHILSTIFRRAGLISCSPILCGFLAFAINSEQSNDASVALCKSSVPAFSKAFLMSVDRLDSANCFLLLKYSRLSPIVSGCLVSWCRFSLHGFMLWLASFSPQMTHSGRKLSSPSIKPKSMYLSRYCFVFFFGTDEPSVHLRFTDIFFLCKVRLTNEGNNQHCPPPTSWPEGCLRKFRGHIIMNLNVDQWYVLTGIKHRFDYPIGCYWGFIHLMWIFFFSQVTTSAQTHLCAPLAISGAPYWGARTPGWEPLVYSIECSTEV